VNTLVLADAGASLPLLVGPRLQWSTVGIEHVPATTGGVDPAGHTRTPPAAETTVESAEKKANQTALTVVAWALLTVAIMPGSFRSFVNKPLENWATVFLSLTLQALPFLVMGVVISAAVAAFVPSRWLVRAFPKKARYAVPAAGAAGMLLPGCECSSVPVAGRLVSRGVPTAAALTFLLAAPAINPVVLASTAVAFPGAPEMVLARLVASFAVAVIVGAIWTTLASDDVLERRLAEYVRRSHAHRFMETAVHDFLQAGGFLVMGAALVATMQTVIPQSTLDALGGHGLVAVVVLAVLAVVLSICSEADAFVAAGLSQFSLTARLAFLVVGPMVDIKLVALQIAAFGRRFAVRFAPLTFVTGIVISILVGTVLL
jgi:uncharacterized membrane protein YraQ (UPF0718 family)